MYQLIFKQKIRTGFEQMSRGDFDKVVALFAPDVHFTFAGNHALGANLRSQTRVKDWFARVHQLFPTLKIQAERIFIAGMPWDVVATTQFKVSDTLPDGTPYENRGVQILRIRFGKIVEDHLIEDNLILQTILEQLANLGNAEAHTAPMLD